MKPHYDRDREEAMAGICFTVFFGGVGALVAFGVGMEIHKWMMILGGN